MPDKSVYSSQRNPCHGKPVLSVFKWPFQGGLLLLLLLLGLVPGCGRQVEASSVKHIKDGGSGPVVVLGDSLSAGVDIPREATWVSLVAERLKHNIVNHSTTGLTTAAALPMVKEEVIPLSPRLVVVELGGNDALQRVEQTATRANLQSIIEQLHGERIPVLLLGVKGGLMSDPYENMYSDLSRKNKTAYISNILDGLLGHPELLVDQFHPNAKGHEMMANRIEPVLKELLEEQGDRS